MLYYLGDKSTKKKHNKPQKIRKKKGNKKIQQSNYIIGYKNHRVDYIMSRQKRLFKSFTSLVHL